MAGEISRRQLEETGRTSLAVHVDAPWRGRDRGGALWWRVTLQLKGETMPVYWSKEQFDFFISELFGIKDQLTRANQEAATANHRRVSQSLQLHGIERQLGILNNTLAAVVHAMGSNMNASGVRDGFDAATLHMAGPVDMTGKGEGDGTDVH